MSEAEEIYDIADIGRGVNGSGVARRAASRALKVFLCDSTCLASLKLGLRPSDPRRPSRDEV